MSPQPKTGITRAVDRVFATLVRLWPAGSRDWALAMQAELPEIHNPQESLRWLAGGIMSLGKAWWNELFSGSNAEGKNLTPVKRPGALAGVTVLAALALLLLPSVHQGLHAVTESWRSDQSSVEHDQLLNLARDAESRGDAKTVAFVAMRIWPPSDYVSLANKAVAMDPSLTWIFSQGYYMTYRNPEARDWPAKFQAWDPGNATGYLLEAEVRSGEFNPDFKKPYEAIQSDPKWLEAGRKAIEAPRYETYRARRMAFDREVILALGSKSPDLISVSAFRLGGASTSSVTVYSKRLITDAKLALTRGDKATAIRDAWTVVHFGELVRSHGGSEMERFWSFQYLKPAFEILQPMLASEGRTEEATMLSQEMEAMTVRYPTGMFSTWSTSSQAWIITSSWGMNLGTLFSIVLFAALLMAGFWLLAARFSPDLASGKLFRSACWTARFAPAGLIVSLFVLAVSYWPNSVALRTYLEQPLTDSTMRSLRETYYAVYWLPQRVLHPASGANDSVFWMFVISFGAIAVLAIIGRNIAHRAPRVKAA